MLKKIIDLLAALLGSQKGAALALSKGGWEGWLQCELWMALVAEGAPVERELAYPLEDHTWYCDLVIGSGRPQIWIEIKAFGIMRRNTPFVDLIRQDAYKLEHLPRGDKALQIVVVPKAIGAQVKRQLQRVWRNFEGRETKTCIIFFRHWTASG